MYEAVGSGEYISERDEYLSSEEIYTRKVMSAISKDT